MAGWSGWIGWGLAAGAAASAVLAAPGQPEAPVSREAAQFFEAKVRPVLVARCYGCHSAESHPVQGGLRLDSRAAMLKGGPRGPALVPGRPEASPLVQAVRHQAGLQMPPAGKLREPEIAALTAWVKQGAPWPEGGPAPAPADGKSHWAYQPPRLPALPKVRRAAWCADPLDRFILEGLEAKGLTPAPAADRRTLIRRATFDLTGLPPTPEEVREFVSDTRPDAFARVVDRLLASPAYGERWGRHWLDVARYADSNGLDENLVYPNAWRYRDYVIRSINADKPVDRFIQEQLAGDLLPPSDDAASRFDGIIATGFLSLGPKMLAEDDPVKQEEDIIDEQIDTLGKAFMGLTLGCARCHDHKFDPFPQTDYYALAGIFKSTRTMVSHKVVAEWQEVPLAGPAERQRAEELEQAIQAKRAEQARKREAAGAVLLTEARKRSADYVRVARELERQPAAAALRPALSAESPAEAPVPAGAIRIEAEDYVTGNVLKDRESYGRAIGVLVNAGQYPNVAEYAVTAPEAGPYQLDLRYASGDPRPVRIRINGALVRNGAAGQVTGGFFPQHQRWFAEGVFRLTAGRNVIRLERDSFFPHVDKLLLTRAPVEYPRTPEQAAAEAGLVPELLLQAREQLKAGQDGEPRFELPEKPDPLLPAEARAEIQSLDREIQKLQGEKPVLPRAMAVSEGKATDVKVHLRGNYLTLGQDCPRGFPAVLTASPAAIPQQSSGRLELARWLTAPQHPLTARVFVNRVWRWHFGRGLVPSTDNFGKLGEPPTHPALLDWLAVTFMRDGWSLKKLHRRILLSSTYQMSSRFDPAAARVDPENKLHWRWDRRRLEAEAVRDAILAVSGDLDRAAGGSLLNFKDREYVTSTANADPVNYRSNRRSVYLPVIRSALYDVFTAFDFGDPAVMNGDRSTTTVAPQALFFMNSPLVLEHTRSMTGRLLARADLDDGGRVRLAYESCFGRPPSGAEVSRATQFLTRVEQAYGGSEPDAGKRRARAWQSLCKALLQSNEFVYLD